MLWSNGVPIAVAVPEPPSRTPSQVIQHYFSHLMIGQNPAAADGLAQAVIYAAERHEIQPGKPIQDYFRRQIGECPLLCDSIAQEVIEAASLDAKSTKPDRK
jgi:hypothetical protein